MSSKNEDKTTPVEDQPKKVLATGASGDPNHPELGAPGHPLVAPKDDTQPPEHVILDVPEQQEEK